MTPSAPLSLAQLQSTDCRHKTPADAMPPAAIQAQLTVLPEWRHADGALRRGYAFADYYHTLAFVNAIAWVIHRQDHHPELTVTYNRVDVAFNTHSAQGISLNDFVCAARLDQVYGP